MANHTASLSPGLQSAIRRLLLGADPPLRIRVIHQSDYRRVAQIEKATYGRLGCAWDFEQIEAVLSNLRVAGLVAVDKRTRQIVGYLIDQVGETAFEVIRLAVDPDYQRQGVGSALVACLAEKLHPDRRRVILTLVRDTWLPAQLFLRDGCGARAISIVGTEREWYRFTLGPAGGGE